ncbi:MAG: hypothetical protein ABI359_11485 [Ginsengibacter sp.]
MRNNFDDFEPLLPSRPSFLTWLCILTFIGSGWSIVNSIWSYSMAGKTFVIRTEKSVSINDSIRVDSTALENQHSNSVFPQKIKASIAKMLTKENIRKGAIGRLLAAFFTLTGAILMWRLNRKGFYLYILGIIIGLIVPFYLFGNDLIAVGASSFSTFFGLIFIALYALNLSSMKPKPTETAYEEKK